MPQDNRTEQAGTPPDILNRPDATQRAEPTDIFKDLDALREKSKITVKRKTVLINVGVGRPANNVYFRTLQIRTKPRPIFNNMTRANYALF
jgi:hypothetical protein